MEPDVRNLWDIEQIKQLKARYFRAMDTKQWDGFDELWASEAVAGRGDAALRGRQDIVDYIVGQSERARTVHHGHMPEIEILPDGTARGVFAMFDSYEEILGDPPKGFTGFGHYHDTFVVEDGEWRIASTVLTRLRIDPMPGGLPDFYARARQ